MPFNYSRSFRYQTKPSKAALERWLNKTREIIDRFSPEMLWFDGGLGSVREDYKKEMAAYYYSQAEKKGREGIISHKGDDMVPGSAIADIELGGSDRLQYGEWLSDTSVDKGSIANHNIAWSWTRDAVYKEPVEIIQCLVENISKNGFLLLNVGPHPDGSIPEEVKTLLGGIGEWLEVNGEAVYGTTPWFQYGEGPTKPPSGNFADAGGEAIKYTPLDIRYTAKGSVIYAFTFAWSDEYKLTALKNLYPGEVTRVTMLGSDEPLSFHQTHHDGLRVTAPRIRPGKYLHTLKIERSGEGR
jgi:alpha-L-fucosidase